MADPEKQKRNQLDILVAIIQAARPVHWIKNLAIFAALIFSGTLFAQGYIEKVILAFVAFNFATSATYIFNDIIDVDRDRLHPRKSLRPIASGRLPVKMAILAAFISALISVILGQSLNPLFTVLTLAYLTIQVSYSLFLKNIPTLDIITIATGFVIRIYAGALIINAHLSVWFLLCVVSVSLFLASGKRRAELNLIEETSQLTRKSLSKYKRELLNSYVTMFANAAWMSWALFTFFESPTAKQPVWLFLAELSRATTINKLLMITIPIVIFGIMRYESLIFENKSEAPEKLLLTDKSLMVAATIWTLFIIWIFYGGVAETGISGI